MTVLLVGELVILIGLVAYALFRPGRNRPWEQRRLRRRWRQGVVARRPSRSDEAET